MTVRKITSTNLDPILDSINKILYKNMSNTGNYPPHNIIMVDENNSIIEIALAGFSKEDVEITIKNDRGIRCLVVEGMAVRDTEEEEPCYFYKGISSRSFELSFPLAEHVDNFDAKMVNGMLIINVGREVPKELKPKQIEIK